MYAMYAVELIFFHACLAVSIFAFKAPCLAASREEEGGRHDKNKNADGEICFPYMSCSHVPILF